MEPKIIYTVNGKEFRFQGGLYRDTNGKPVCNDIQYAESGYHLCTLPVGHDGDVHRAEDTGHEWSVTRGE